MKRKKKIEKKSGRERWNQIKNKFKINKIFLYAFWNLFYLFFFMI